MKISSGYVVFCVFLLTNCATSTQAELTGQEQSGSSGRLDIIPASLALPHDFLDTIKILDMSGESVHEAESKQPRFILGLIEDVLERAKLGQVENRELSTWITSGQTVPRYFKPSEGFSGPIGAEIYSRSPESAVVAEDSTKPDPAQLSEIRASIEILAAQLSAAGYPTTEGLLKQFLLERPSAMGVSRAVVQVPNGVETFLRSAGFWTRPKLSHRQIRQNQISPHALYTIGEQSLARNRALLLLQIVDKMGEKIGDPVAARQALSALSSAQKSSSLLWSRTHLVVAPPPDSDVGLAVGSFSALLYSFLVIEDVGNEDFVMHVLSYPFVYAEPVWNQEKSKQILAAMCSADGMANLANQEKCETFATQYQNAGEPSLQTFEKLGMGSSLAVSGYGPLLLSTERVQLSSLTPDLIENLRIALQL